MSIWYYNPGVKNERAQIVCTAQTSNSTREGLPRSLCTMISSTSSKSAFNGLYKSTEMPKEYRTLLEEVIKYLAHIAARRDYNAFLKKQGLSYTETNHEEVEDE